MRVFRIVLMALFCLLALLKLWLIVSLALPLYFVVLVLLPLCVTTALAGVEGKVVRLIAFFYSGVLIVCGMLFIVMVVSTFFNHEYDSISPVVMAVLGLSGCSAFFMLKKRNSASAGLTE